MPINITNLFTVLGKIAKTARIHSQYQANVGTNFSSVLSDLNSFGYSQAATGFDIFRYAFLDSTGQNFELARNLFASTIRNAVFNDNSVYSESMSLSCEEVIRQMKSGGHSVPSPTVGVSVTPWSNNSGDGMLFADLTNPDGSQRSLVIPETNSVAIFEGTPASSNESSGRESFTYMSKMASNTGTSSVFAYQYPLGPGAKTTIGSQTPLSSILGNGTFNQFNADNTPTGWSVVTGTPVTHYAAETATTYNGTRCIAFNPVATLVNFRKSITGVRINTRYMVACKLRKEPGATGVVRFSLKRANGNYVVGADGNNCTTTVNLSAVSATSFQWHTWWFSSPQIIPGQMFFHVEVDTAISGGKLFLDWLGLYDSVNAYRNGPNLRLVAGIDRFNTGDRFYIDVTNNFAGATYLSTWQWAWFRFGGLGYLPESSTPTISDSLLV